MAEIELKRVNLKFRIRERKKITLKEYLLKGFFHASKNPVVEVHALQDIDLHLQDGDRLGVIGHNGAGKSTLLKLMAGIYPPTSGTRRVQGNICSLFDISLGFEAEANGWDNIQYRGYLQGETPTTLKKKVHEIAEFSELGRFLDVPVRYYSAGMLIRLAFSIASASEPEILLIDEVLSVGDLGFQIKARRRMEEMMRKASLLVLISHDLSALAELCSTAVWIDHGRIVQLGKASEVVAAYKGNIGKPVPPIPVAA
jgi:ABC-type polysaccharide/polyol phosphate transport system ATPase subunit